MKKIIILLFIVTSTMTACGQNTTASTEPVEPKDCNNAVYQLFPTTNMWTFLKLDTRNGKIWQVQYSTEANERFETYLSLLSLVDESKYENGRFTLYATKNMWNFILLDQIDGTTWQVQWSQDSENRGIVPISY